MPTSNFIFLIGAPKCGTTSIAEWLGRHNKIYLMPHKEPGFFRTQKGGWVLDANFPERLSTPKLHMLDFHAYKALSSLATEDQWALDASTDYLSDIGSPLEIKKFAENNNVKLICILRDPLERAYSEYRHTVRDKIEPYSYLMSLVREGDRKIKGYQPLFLHAERSRYFAGIERFRDAFGDSILILDFHDDRKDRTFQEEITAFLSLDRADLGPVPMKNASRPNKSLRNRIARIIAGDTYIERDFKEGTLFLYSKIKEDIERCMQDPAIQTSNWRRVLWAKNQMPLK